MHTTAKLLHFDLKPENILVTPDGVPFVTDLGFARELRQYSDGETVQVGFTWKYGHPRLPKPDKGAKISRVPEKSKVPLPGRDLAPIFDVFAFGRTLQQVLQRLSKEYGEQIQSQYEFNYLHFLACLCLDGANSPRSDDEDFISDYAMGFPDKLFKRNKFSNFGQISACLERLIGHRRLEEDLPEADPWFGSTIKVSDFGATTLTPRLEAMINHPALQRLKREKQLGMLDSVFPTANHTRFQHTLGTYHAVTQYIAALYHDPDNPVFKALFDAEQCATALVAALCHDLGQTAYGHELEEIDKDEFNHESLVEPIIISRKFRDDSDRTLRQVIEGDGENGWNISADAVLKMLKDGDLAKNALGKILHEMLDSQIDADKFDYLIRDSVESRVSYGHGIDHERFLRSLTTYVDPETGSLRLAIKQKGAASAESFIYARYQLYQSLYWHHTFRATKAMLLEGVRLIVEELQAANHQAELFSHHTLRDEYARRVIGVEVPATRRPVKKGGNPSAQDIIAKRLKEVEAEDLPVPYETDLTMKFLWGVSEGKARELFNDLISRRYYKRIYELSPDRVQLGSWQELHKRFQGSGRKGIQESVQQELTNALRGELASRSGVMHSLDRDGVMARFEELVNEKALFLVDIPLRGWYAANKAPVYVSDYKRRHFRAAAAGAGGVEHREDFWIETMGDLMKGIAFVRVFCEPETHSLLTRFMDADLVKKAVAQAIPELGNLKQQ